MTDFDLFLDKLQGRLALPLPGAAVHDLMRAVPVGDIRPRFENAVPPKPGSVLILLYPREGSIKFPLTLRNDYPGAHGGQVSFPGGKSELNETYKETALRECQEEIGVAPESVEVIGRLTEFFVIPSNFLVTPVVGVCRKIPEFRPDPIEVAKILEGDIYELAQDDAIRTSEILAAKRYRMQAPHFDIDGQIVWGATAMMLNEFRSIIKDIL